MAKNKTGGKVTKSARKQLQTYVDKYLKQGGSILKIAKGSGMHSQTITNFLNQDSCPRLDKWHDLLKFMEQNPMK